MDAETVTFLQRIDRLERRLRLLSGAWVLTLTAAALYACTSQSPGGTPLPQSSPETLRVQELVVVDSAGVVRARIGGNLPDAVIQGRTAPRGDNAAGILLYDNTGQERGGYVTFDSSGLVALTLDGREKQTAFFVADTSGATALRVWHEKDLVELRASEDGARFTAVSNGQVMFQEPEIKHPESTAACSALRGFRERVDQARLMTACRER